MVIGRYNNSTVACFGIHVDSKWSSEGVPNDRDALILCQQGSSKVLQPASNETVGHLVRLLFIFMHGDYNNKRGKSLVRDRLMQRKETVPRS